MTITIYDTAEAIRSTLADAVDRAQANESLTDGMNDLTALQVYFERLETSYGGRTDRVTFGGGVRRNQWVFTVDVYARQRSHIGEDMAAVANVADAVNDELEAQAGGTLFGLTGIKTFHWTAERVIFVYGDPETRYAGIRYTLTLIVG